MSEATNGPHDEPPPIVKRAGEIEAQPARRPLMRFFKLLSEAESREQNWILSEAEEGAFVEDHPVARSEAFYVLEGEIDVFGPGWRELVRKGDFIYFAAGASHGMRVIRGPARYLVVFA